MANNQITPFQLTDQFTMDNFNQRINETNTALQNKMGGIESTDYPGCYYRTVDGVVEWFNPPMILNKEYRTTERYLGRPVYAQLVDCGKTVTGKLTYPHGIQNIQYCVRFNMAVSNNTEAFNGATVLPSIDDPTTLNGRWNNYPLLFDRTNVSMYCGGGLANCSVYATLWYTKSTDE